MCKRLFRFDRRPWTIWILSVFFVVYLAIKSCNREYDEVRMLATNARFVTADLILLLLRF